MTLKLLFVPLLALSLHGAVSYLSTHDIGEILEGKQTRGDRQASCTMAYNALLEKIGDPTSKEGLARLLDILSGVFAEESVNGSAKLHH